MTWRWRQFRIWRYRRHAARTLGVYLAVIFLTLGITIATGCGGQAQAKPIPTTAAGCIAAVNAKHVSLKVWDYCTALDRHGDHPRLNAALWKNFERVIRDWSTHR